MNIRNFNELATTSLRKQALLILEAGLSAIHTPRAVEVAVTYNAKKDVLRVQEVSYALKGKGKVVVVGFGKAAFDAVSVLYELMETRITCGFVLDLKGGSQGSLTCTVGSHPFPTLVNVEATKQIIEVVKSLTEQDVLLCVVSGGGSSLLCYPYELSCEREVQIVQTLMRAGATIQELNTVRKHISLVKGGQLAEVAFPAQIINLVFSDVPGDDIALVASGPTLLDTTTVHDASRVLSKYHVLELCSLPDCNLKETPKDKKYFEKVSSHLLVSGKQALVAMKEKAADLGFKPRIYREGYSGIAKELGTEFISANRSGECLLASGESTVQVKVEAKGGRNLEMALAALPAIAEDQVFIALDSDGYDNTPFAGALVDKQTMEKARRLHMDPKLELEGNCSYIFFEATGDYIDTGLTGANVADLVISLRN